MKITLREREKITKEIRDLLWKSYSYAPHREKVLNEVRDDLEKSESLQTIIVKSKIIDLLLIKQKDKLDKEDAISILEDLVAEFNKHSIKGTS
ncbi:MAG: hypothetical protein QG670_1424 [Thermoproteota archaeon]|nr:hypothetical protein [Thermoproteota archaeon]